MAIAFEQTIADAIAALERDLGLTSTELAGGLGVTTRTLDRWRKGESLPQRDARERLGALVSVRDHAYETLLADEVGRWIRSSLPVLAGLSPADLIRSGRADRVDHVLGAIEHGIYL